MKITTLVLSMLLFSGALLAQNLVQNPSFENTSACPLVPSELTKAFNWDDLNTNVGGDSCSSPDLYATCSWTIGGVNSPAALLGYQNSRTGTHHAGIIVESRPLIISSCPPAAGSVDNYREYLGGELSAPLVAGQSYCVQMYVNLATRSGWGIDKLGFYFYNSASSIAKDFCASPAPIIIPTNDPKLLMTSGTPFMDTVNWVLVNWNYVAQGGENRFAIGNFFASNTQSRIGNDCAASNLQGGTYSYYFIDDVSVTAGTCCITSVTDPGPLCVNDAPFNLVPQTPGGTFSGTGITNGSLGTFDPSIAGVGTFTISYQLGCGTGTFQITVNNCTTLSVCQETNGSLTVSGGTAPYTWQSQTTTQDCSACLIGCTFPPGCAVNVTNWNTYSTAATAMPPGTFPIQVLDNGGNSQLITTLAGIPACSAPCPTVTVSISNQEDISCFGLSDGAAVASASGGNGTYNYSWMPGSLSGASQNTLDNTTYTITATDGNGCTGSTTVTIAEPSELLASVNTTPTDCGAATGSATASYTGGTGTVSYSWNPGGQTTAVISNVSAGVYTVTVEDQNGCTAQASGNVNTFNGPVLTTQVLQQVSCFNGADGSASVQVTGGTSPFSIAWSPSGETTTTAVQLEAGTNTVTVTDAGGCVATATVQITEPSAIQITGVVTNEQCGALDGAVDATFTGGTGSLTPSWSNGASTADISGLNNGTYSLTVTDQNGCTAVQDFTVLQDGSLAASVSPTSASIDAGDSVSIAVSGGTIFNWVPSTGLNCDTCATVIATPSETTIYVVIVSDPSGCSDTLSVTIGVTPVCGELFVPNMFSPNLDNLNDQLCVMGACFSEVVFSIYNRWGELIFETDDLTKCWDGTYKSKAANPDVYVYKLIGTKLDGTDVNTSGNIQLVR